MKKGERLLFLSVLAVLAAALALFLFQLGAGAGTHEVYRVSVLLDGSDTEYWRNFLNGLNQAALEQNVDVRVVSRYDGDPAEAQSDAIRRAWEGETDGIVLVPLNGDAVVAVLDEAPANLALSVLGPKLDTGHKARYVSPDYAALGARLADAAAGEALCTLYLPAGSGSAARLVCGGAAARLTELGVPWVKEDTLPDGDAVLPRGGLIAPDPATAEALCGLRDAAGRVYALGTSNRLLHYLQDGTAAILAVQSDYDAGYLCLMGVVDALEGRRGADAALESYTVTQENLFEHPLVDFLFSTP